MALMFWTIACLAVLLAVMFRALNRAPKMPEWMEVQDENLRLFFRETRLTQRPASERFKDLGGQL